jgi:integrase
VVRPGPGERYLIIQQQLQQIAGQGYALVSPKTKAGRRQIKLGVETLKRLEANRAQQELIKDAAGDVWQEHGLLFTSNSGTYLVQCKVPRELKKVLKKAGLPPIRFHDLRHTSISFLLEMGMPVNTVQQRSGYSKASVTTDIYCHPMARSQDEAAQKTEEVVTPIAVDLQ